MFYLYFHSLTFALQENGPFSKSCEVSAFPAAVSRDEIEQLRVQAAAAVRSYREALAAAATDAQGGTTADDARTDLRLIRQEAQYLLDKLLPFLRLHVLHCMIVRLQLLELSTAQFHHKMQQQGTQQLHKISRKAHFPAMQMLVS